MQRELPVLYPQINFATYLQRLQRQKITSMEYGSGKYLVKKGYG